MVHVIWGVIVALALLLIEHNTSNLRKEIKHMNRTLESISKQIKDTDNR